MTTTPVRRLSALSLVLAPALMGAALLTDVTPQADGTADLLKLIAEKPAEWSTGQTLFFLSGMAWFPAGLALMRLFGREARAGRFAGAAVIIGGLAVLPVDAAGLYLRELATSGLPLDQQVSLVEGVESSPTLLVFETVHVVGLFLGLLVVGVALLRVQGLSRWAGVLVLAGLVGLVASPGRPLLAVATVLLVAGFGVAAAHRAGLASRDAGERRTRTVAHSTGEGSGR